MIPRSAVQIFRSRVLGRAERDPDGSDRRARAERCQPGERLTLALEPGLRGGIRVLRLSGEDLGRLPRHWPRQIAHRLRRGWRYAAVVTEPFEATGRRGRRGLGLAVVAARPETPDEVWEAALEGALAPPRGRQVLAGLLVLLALLALFWLLRR